MTNRQKATLLARIEHQMTVGHTPFMLRECLVALIAEYKPSPDWQIAKVQALVNGYLREVLAPK